MKRLLLSVVLALSINSYSQEVISTQGDSYINTNGSIDFTIGEVISNTTSSGEIELTQGFHQSNWNFLSIDNHGKNIEATVYPNPMGSQLNINTSPNKLSYVMYNAQGKLIAKNQLNSQETIIDVILYAPGSYSLVLINKNKEQLKTFKLLKIF